MPPDEPHPFATMRETMRKKGGGGFDKLTERQQWEWHADVYAFRHVTLGIKADMRVSPADPDGKWYNPGMVETCVAYWRRKYTNPEQRKRQAEHADRQREGRDILTQWVRSQGFVSLDDYCERHGNDELAAHRDYLKSPEFRAAARTTGCG